MKPSDCAIITSIYHAALQKLVISKYNVTRMLIWLSRDIS